MVNKDFTTLGVIALKAAEEAGIDISIKSMYVNKDGMKIEYSNGDKATLDKDGNYKLIKK